MKRLISLIIVVFLVSLASQSALAANGDERRDQREVQQEDGGLFSHNPYLKNYLPTDMYLVDNDSVGKACNINGAIDAKEKFHCMEYVSPSTKEHFRIRQSGTDGMRVFFRKNKTLNLYLSIAPNPAQWKKGGIYENPTITYESGQAQQYAQAHGDQNTDVAVGKPVPTQTKPAEQTATVDCSKGTLFEKMQCLGKNPAIGAVINKLPSF